MFKTRNHGFRVGKGPDRQFVQHTPFTDKENEDQGGHITSPRLPT